MAPLWAAEDITLSGMFCQVSGDHSNFLCLDHGICWKKGKKIIVIFKTAIMSRRLRLQILQVQLENKEGVTISATVFVQRGGNVAMVVGAVMDLEAASLQPPPHEQFTSTLRLEDGEVGCSYETNLIVCCSSNLMCPSSIRRLYEYGILDCLPEYKWSTNIVRRFSVVFIRYEDLKEQDHRKIWTRPSPRSQNFEQVTKTWFLNGRLKEAVVHGP